MAVFLDQTFTDTNGDPWPAGWTGTGGTSSIQGNAGRLATPATAFAPARQSHAGVQDGDAIIEFTISTVAEHYHDIAFRVASTTSAYSLQLAPAGSTIALARWNGTDTQLDSASFTLTAGGRYLARLRWVGSLLQASVWGVNDTEPEAWMLEATNTAITAAGTFQYWLTAGTAATARSVDIHNISIRDLASDAPSGGTTAASTFSWGSPVDAALTALDQVHDPGSNYLIFTADDQWGVKDPAQVVLDEDGYITMSGTPDRRAGGFGYYPDPAEMYGRYEILARVLYGDWLWWFVNLLWPVSNVWPGGREIDFAELPAGTETGDRPVDVGSNYHYPTDGDPDSEDFENDSQIQEVADDVAVGDWTYFAVEWGPDFIRSYVNGALIHEAPLVDAPEVFPPAPMRLGVQLDSHDDNEPAEGVAPVRVQIAEIRKFAIDSSPPVTSRRHPPTNRARLVRAANF